VTAMQRTAFRSCLRPLQAIPRPLQASELVARRSFASVSAPRPKSLNVSRIGLGLGLAGSLAYWSTQKPLLCDVLADPAIPAPTAAPGDFPQSNVSLYSLGFGTAAGICAGVFVAKGLNMIAFFLGGLFVLTQVRPPSPARSRLIEAQYTTSKSLTEVKWGAMGKRYTTAVDGPSPHHPPVSLT
jgi:hypothetical protein